MKYQVIEDSPESVVLETKTGKRKFSIGANREVYEFVNYDKRMFQPGNRRTQPGDREIVKSHEQLSRTEGDALVVKPTETLKQVIEREYEASLET